MLELVGLLAGLAAGFLFPWAIPSQYSLYAAAGLLGWQRVSCVDSSGAVRSIEDIHREIWDIITGQNLLCSPN